MVSLWALGRGLQRTQTSGSQLPCPLHPGSGRDSASASHLSPGLWSLKTLLSLPVCPCVLVCPCGHCAGPSLGWRASPGSCACHCCWRMSQSQRMAPVGTDKELSDLLDFSMVSQAPLLPTSAQASCSGDWGRLSRGRHVRGLSLWLSWALPQWAGVGSLGRQPPPPQCVQYQGSVQPQDGSRLPPYIDGETEVQRQAGAARSQASPWGWSSGVSALRPQPGW